MLTFRIRLAPALWACLILPSTRATATESGSSLEVKHEFFWDRNGVWNHTPAFAFRQMLSRKWSLGWEQELDVVSGASRHLGSDNTGPFGNQELDAVSGASKIEVRHSENPALTYSHKGTSLSGSFYYSREDDYISRSPGISWSRDFNERNTTLGLSYGEFFDEFRPKGAFAKEGGGKRIRTLGGTLAQSLTPLTLVAVTGTYVNSWGYLGHPYNPPMDIQGTLLTEVLPDRKRAGAVSGQIVQGFRLGENLASFNLDVRRYQDDWGLKSTTADMKFSKYVSEGAYFRLRARYYSQTRALFAKDYYLGTEAFRTADVRFFPFSSLLLGAKVSGPFPELFGESAFLPDRWDFKYDHMLRDTRGDPAAGPAGEPRRMRYQLYDPDEQYLQGVFMMGLLFNL